MADLYQRPNATINNITKAKNYKIISLRHHDVKSLYLNNWNNKCRKKYLTRFSLCNYYCLFVKGTSDFVELYI